MSKSYIPAISFVMLSLFVLTGCADGHETEITLRTSAAPINNIQIYIGGDINNPGYYFIKDGDTVSSLINAAGGTLYNSEIIRLELTVNDPETEEAQKVDINRAPDWLLEALPGIGKTRAQSIIQYRTQNGRFDNINELLNVEGIGQETFNNIADLITASD